LRGATRFPTRRDLLNAIGGAGLASLASPVLRAQGVRGNRALVCIYFPEGNDSNNMVVPVDGARYSAYAAARGSLALDRTSLLTASTPSGGEIGFHPSMGELRDLFAAQRVAVVANVGAPDGAPPAHLLDSNLTYLPGGIAAPQWAAAFTQSGVVSASEVAAGSLGTRSIVRLASAPAGATSSSPEWSRAFPQTRAGIQLERVAAALAQRPEGAQFFFVPTSTVAIGKSPLDRFAAAWRDLSVAMATFYSATMELGIGYDVTTYTDGPFNRAMAPTAHGGALPAWGGHQLVMGGSVLGGEIYGNFPDFTLGGPSDAGKTGIWKPGITKAEYYMALAKWAGLPDLELGRIFRSSASQPRLGFLA